MSLNVLNCITPKKSQLLANVNNEVVNPNDMIIRVNLIIVILNLYFGSKGCC